MKDQWSQRLHDPPVTYNMKFIVFAPLSCYFTYYVFIVIQNDTSASKTSSREKVLHIIPLLPYNFSQRQIHSAISLFNNAKLHPITPFSNVIVDRRTNAFFHLF